MKRQHDEKDTLAVIPWYWRDWRASKARAVLSIEGRAVYRELLDAQWAEPDCALPKDDDHLAGLAGVPREVWILVRAQVLAFFDETEDGRWQNPRVLFEWKKARKFRRAKRAAGSAGGLRRLKLDSKNKENRRVRLARAQGRATHTAQEWADVLAFFGGHCVRCGDSGGVMKDHIIPLYQNDSSDGIENLQPLCKRCSSGKGPERIDHRINKMGVGGTAWEAFAAQRGWSLAGSVVEPGSPSPSPSPSPTNNTTATGILEFYNRVTGRRLTPATQAKFVTPRLQEGVTPQTLRLAVLGACLNPFHLGKNDREAVYLDPETIFRPARLDGHAEHARHATFRIPGADDVWQFWTKRLKTGRLGVMRHFFIARDEVLREEGSVPLGPPAAYGSEYRAEDEWPESA